MLRAVGAKSSDRLLSSFKDEDQDVQIEAQLETLQDHDLYQCCDFVDLARSFQQNGDSADSSGSCSVSDHSLAETALF